jgi:hypothetical protein
MFRSGPKPGLRERGRVRRGPSSVRRPPGPRPQDEEAGSRPCGRRVRPALRTARRRRWRRAAPTPPRRPRGGPPPSGPVAVLPCEPWTPPCHSACSSTLRRVSCTSGIAAPASRGLHATGRLAHGDRELHGVPNATPGTLRRAPRRRPGTTARARSDDHSSPPPGVRWAPSACRGTMLQRCCTLSGRGVCPGVLASPPGQPTI